MLASATTTTTIRNITPSKLLMLTCHTHHAGNLTHIIVTVLYRGLLQHPRNRRGIPQHLRVLEKSGAGLPYLQGAKLEQGVTTSLRLGLAKSRLMEINLVRAASWMYCFESVFSSISCVPPMVLSMEFGC